MRERKEIRILKHIRKARVKWGLFRLDHNVKQSVVWEGGSMHRRGACHAHIQLLVFYSRLEHKAGPGKDISTESLALVNSLLRGDLEVI